MFASIEEVIERFAGQSYIASRRIATVVYLAAALKKPILVEGPAGVGKTDLAKVLALSLGRELIRLQCYEGLDEGKALYEWEYAKQLLYTQILKDKISEVLTGAQGLAAAVDRIAKEDEVFFSERFVLPRPLLKAITSEKPVVLLIDEIDKADAEFEAFLLELLSDFQVTVPEIGTIQGAPDSAGRADLEQRARDVRRAQATLPASVHRFSRARPGNRDYQAQGARGGRQARRRSGDRGAVAAQARSQEDPRHQRDDRLGQGADAAQRAESRPGRWSTRRSTRSSSTKATCARRRRSSRSTCGVRARGAAATPAQPAVPQRATRIC